MTDDSGAKDIKIQATISALTKKYERPQLPEVAVRHLVTPPSHSMSGLGLNKEPISGNRTTNLDLAANARVTCSICGANRELNELARLITRDATFLYCPAHL